MTSPIRIADAEFQIGDTAFVWHDFAPVSVVVQSASDRLPHAE